MKINKTYLLATVLLLITEILIATFLKAGFIRHTFGDYLATILIYCFVKIFFEIDSLKLGVSVLIFAFIIEFLQLINLLKILNLQNDPLLKIIVGTTFEISDLVAYTLGIITVLIVEFKTTNS
ncbi:DUF2809 domain-containing protein [uncultured Algibacter sp.]|uniref:ribosomal maturation YjgA family protein n=1 Tax=uncultured Algibacter sp. TaxID=298659 RepID=UPI00262243AE|nr:DUF2809 domain-containing protein [uncultured Algibacter sp.]